MSNLSIRPLDPPLQKVAIEELNEVPERVPEDIEALRTWINQQPHLKARTDDQFLVGFLRGCKWSMEKAKSKIDKFYAMRTKYPELFNGTNVDDPNLKKFLRLGVMVPLPTPLHENGPRIYIFRHGAYNPSDYSIEEVSIYFNIFHDIIIREDDYAIINGFVIIMDLANASMAHFMHMTPAMMKKWTVFNEEAIPLRQKAGHAVNCPSFFEKIFNTFKPLMPKKQQERMYLHGENMESLYKFIPKKYLPKEYGGENGSMPEIIEERIAKLEEYREYLRDNVNYGTDESLRVGKPIDFEGLFGLDGSFRKLNVD